MRGRVEASPCQGPGRERIHSDGSNEESECRDFLPRGGQGRRGEGEMLQLPEPGDGRKLLPALACYGNLVIVGPLEEEAWAQRMQGCQRHPLTSLLPPHLLLGTPYG